MWIKQADFLKIVQERAEAQGEKQAVERQLISQKSTMDWMVLRLTQLEHERAQLIYKYTDVKITVPSIEAAPDPKSASAILGETLSFEDIGDEAALAAGIDWNKETGEIVYTKK